MMQLLTTTAAFLLIGGSAGFSARDMNTRRSSVVLSAQSQDAAGESRRAFISQAAGTSAVLLGGLGSGAMLPMPAQAVSGEKKVNAKLTGYGLPVLDKVPDGMTPLLEIYGKGKNRTPLLVSFAHPLSWVKTLPSNNMNGEDGTIQAGDYGKGDTSTFYLYTDQGGVKNIASQNKDLFDKVLRKSIGQRGDNMYQNFKLTKVVPAGDYVIVDFKYQLITGAGFEVDRNGVASITSVGDSVQVLWSATTALRYKKVEQTLRDISSTFRCYSDGINLSEEML
jgi:hypothetical protein